MQRGDVIKGIKGGDAIRWMFLAALYELRPLRAYGVVRFGQDRMRALVYEWTAEQELLVVSHRRDQTLAQLLEEAERAKPYLRLSVRRPGTSQPADAQEIAERIAELLAEGERGDGEEHENSVGAPHAECVDRLHPQVGRVR